MTFCASGLSSLVNSVFLVRADESHKFGDGDGCEKCILDSQRDDKSLNTAAQLMQYTNYMLWDSHSAEHMCDDLMCRETCMLDDRNDSKNCKLTVWGCLFGWLGFVI